MIAPAGDETYRLVNAMNYCDETMSGEAAGIGVSIYALSDLAFLTQSPEIAALYCRLREFAPEHAEFRKIYKFID